jgi:hypothetical protein
LTVAWPFRRAPKDTGGSGEEIHNYRWTLQKIGVFLGNPRGGDSHLSDGGARSQISRIAELESGLDVTSLFAACLTAMVAVFVLLGLLALTMELITATFPERGPSVEPAIVAAITTTVASIFSGARVTRIEEDS